MQPNLDSVAKKYSLGTKKESSRRRLPQLHVMHVSASANGTAQWLGRLEKDSQGSRWFVKSKSVMPDNSAPRSAAWNGVFSALSESDVEALKLLRNLVSIDKFEAFYGLDIGESGWSLLHKAIAFDRVWCTKALLAEGAPSNIEDRKGNSPMRVGVWFNSRRCTAIIDSESKRIHGSRKKSKLKTSALAAFSHSGDRQKAKRRSKEHMERMESKARELNLSLTPIKPSKPSASVKSALSAKTTNSVNRLTEALARIDGSLGGEVELDTSDSWSQSQDNTTLESTYSLASASSLDNWYSQLPNTRKSKREGLWGVVDSEKHQLVRVGQRQLWVSKEPHRDDTAQKIMRYVQETNAQSPTTSRPLSTPQIISPISDG